MSIRPSIKMIDTILLLSKYLQIHFFRLIKENHLENFENIISKNL